jgi:hypothetical protein
VRLDRGNHQHLIEPVKMGGGLHNHVDVRVAIGVAHDLLHHAHRQPTREDLVAPGGEDLFSGLNALVSQNVFNLRAAGGVAAQNAADARGFQYHARAAGRVVDGQHLRRARKNLAHLAHNPVWRDDGHIRLKAVIASLVDIENARLITAAGADGLRGQRLVNVLLLEAHQRLQPLALARVFQQRRLLQAKPVEGLLQILVLLAGVAQVKVVLPQAGRPQLRGVEKLFRGRDHFLGPQPDQAHARRIARVQRAAPAVAAVHLHGQSDDLRQQNGQQHQRIPITDKKRFHDESSCREGNQTESRSITSIPMAACGVAGALRHRRANCAGRFPNLHEECEPRILATREEEFSLE